jgi:hypothetical protein
MINRNVKIAVHLGCVKIYGIFFKSSHEKFEIYRNEIQCSSLQVSSSPHSDPTHHLIVTPLISQRPYLSHSDPTYLTVTPLISQWPHLSHSDPTYLTVTPLISQWPHLSHSDPTHLTVIPLITSRWPTHHHTDLFHHLTDSNHTSPYRKPTCHLWMPHSSPSMTPLIISVTQLIT